MQVSEIKLFQILKEKIGENEAQALVEYVEAKVEGQFESKKDTLASKQDIADFKVTSQQDILKLKQDIADFKVVIQQDISGFKVEMIDRISQTKNTIYIVGLVQFLAIIASILGIFQLYDEVETFQAQRLCKFK